MEHLKTLNEAQKKAVLTTEGAVLVLAGAGAGKTKTIAHRMVHIVKGGVPAHRLLAITFTNKAAREMKERVLALLAEFGVSAQESGVPTISTFHALSALLLRKYGESIGVPRGFVIYDRADSLKAVKKAILEEGEDEKRFEPRAVLSAISRAKGDALSLAEYREKVGNAWYQLTVANVWARYEAFLKKEQAVDFDDLLLLTLKLLREDKRTRNHLQDEWHYIHIDEYQDTNAVQYEIARLLAGERANLFCVGDEDQCLYSWRGASVENILHFAEFFPKATVLRLEQNYRSTKTIIAVSNDIIKKNKKRNKKVLFTENEDGEKISLLVGYNEHDEAEKVAVAIEELLTKGTRPEDIAVLYRANFQSRVLEELFLGYGIPYRVLGTRFFDRKEVKDTLSYLRASLNPESEQDIRRIINTPLRGIGKVTVDKLFAEGREALSGAVGQKVASFFSLLARVRDKTAVEKASEVITYVLAESGIIESLSGKNEEDKERLENVKELVSLAVGRYDELPSPEGIERLLEDAALATDQDELDARTEKTKNGVTLMTVHASKGLEFRYVFITGLEDGLFPHARSGTDSTHDEEEERRLFYVALTRAKEKVFLSYATTRTIFGRMSSQVPSEFLLEIDEEYLEVEKKKGGGKVIYLD